MRIFLTYKKVDTHKETVGNEAHKEIDIREQSSVHRQYAKQKVKVSYIRFTLTYLNNKQFIYINISDLHSIKKQKLVV
jgi:hypothetical protein